jgi:hypothetical protein
VFGSGFAETSDITVSGAGDIQSDVDDAASEAPSFSSSKWTRHFEDSDDEDDEMFTDGPDDTLFESVSNSQIALPSGSLVRRDSVVSLPSPAKDTSGDSATVGSDNETEGRNVRPKLSHPSSPSSTTPALEKQEPEWQHVSKSDPLSGPSKLHVVVKDVAYTTYRAVLYYVGAVISCSNQTNQHCTNTDLHRRHSFCSSFLFLLFLFTDCSAFNICVFAYPIALGEPKQQRRDKDYTAR